LTYQYHDPVDEKAVFWAMWVNGDQAKIRRMGFSLLDIKRFLASRGYVANGYKVPLKKLKQTRVPAIALISDHGYNHYVVVNGIRNDRVLVGDPSRGARSIALDSFRKLMSSPILFVITSNREQAVFNGRSDWATRPLAPLGIAAMTQRLAETTVLAPTPGTF